MVTMSKNESKYRIKFIQEYHYNKQEQKEFDEAKLRLGLSYKQIYFNVHCGYTYVFMASISARRASNVFNNIGCQLIDLSQHLCDFNSALAF